VIVGVGSKVGALARRRDGTIEPPGNCSRRSRFWSRACPVPTPSIREPPLAVGFDNSSQGRLQ